MNSARCGRLRSLGFSTEGARAVLLELRRETAEAMREHHFAWGDELADAGLVPPTCD